MTNFCRLPPDSAPRRVSGPGVRTSNSAITFSAKPRAAGQRRNPRRTSPSAPTPVSSAFSVRLMSGAAAWPSRSSGAAQQPAARRAFGPQPPTSALRQPHRVRRRRGISPDSAASSSSCPLPATPPMPRTSPPAASSRSPSAPCRTRCGAAADRPFTSSSTGPSAPAPRDRRCSAAPTISSRQFARGGLAAGRRSPPPCRAAGSSRVSHSAADLLQLVADVQDRRAFGRQLAQGGEQDLHLLRGQHRGRLVHDQQLRVLQQAADDLDPLPLARRQIAHEPVGVERQAVGLG